MADKYKIVSQDGTTKIFDPSGAEIRNCRSLKIESVAGRLVAFIELIAFSPEIDLEVVESPGSDSNGR
jgi:hypothetical protein